MDPSMQIHVMQEGEQFGPYSKAQLESYLWEGNVQRSDLAWAEGTDEDWLPLWQVIGLPPQPGEIEEQEEEVVTEEAVGPKGSEETEAAPLLVAEEAQVEEISIAEAPPLPEEMIAEAPPLPEAPHLPEEVMPEPPPLPAEPVAAEAPPLPEVEEEAPVPAANDGRPKLVIPAAAPKRKLKLNVPGR
jgi:hypothetical protein